MAEDKLYRVALREVGRAGGQPLFMQLDLGDVGAD